MHLSPTENHSYLMHQLPPSLGYDGGDINELFPIAAMRRAFKDLRRIYNSYDTGNRCHLIVGNGGHRFYTDQAWPVMLKEIKKIKEATSSNQQLKSHC